MAHAASAGRALRLLLAHAASAGRALRLLLAHAASAGRALRLLLAHAACSIRCPAEAEAKVVDANRRIVEVPGGTTKGEP